VSISLGKIKNKLNYSNANSNKKKLRKTLSIGQQLLLLFDRARNRLKLWDLSSTDKLASLTPDSLSELDDYLTICKLAASDDKYFKRFRSCSSYRAILENVDGLSGMQIYKVMTQYGRDLNDYSNLWHTEIGNPYKYHIKGLGYVAPTELRYSKVMSELEILFGNLNDFYIAEIGVGFGGQGGQILSSHSVAKYEFIDLPQPLELVGRYLRAIKQASRATLIPSAKVQSGKRDLVISNYAYSELNSDLQEYYFNKVIKNSLRGFVIYNQITPENYGTMTATQFAARLPGSEIFPENPLSHPGNLVVVWGHLNKLSTL